jgi:putative MATE family efflux protein
MGGDEMEQTIRKKIIKLALPATIEHVLDTLVGFIDTLLIATIGLTAVTAVGLANTVLNVYLAVFIALGIGASSLIARQIGAAKLEQAKLFANQSFLLAILVGLVFGLASIVMAPFILTTMGAHQDILNESVAFFRIVGGASVFIAMMTVLSSILRAAGDTKTPMKISAVVNLLNIILDVILIFGLGPIPALGVVGTAIGTVVSRIIGSFLLYRKVQRSELQFKFSIHNQSTSQKALLKVSIPAVLERLIMRMGQVVYFSLIVGLSAKTFAAHSIAGTIESFVYMPAYGLATAASVLAGHYLGQQDIPAVKKVVRLSVIYGIAILSVLGVGLFVGVPLFATLFTDDPSAKAQVITALRIDAFNQPALAMSLILTGALQGIGDTKTPLVTTAIGVWIIRMLGVLLLGYQFGLGIAGIWLSIGIDLTLRSIILYWRFRKKINESDLT